MMPVYFSGGDTLQIEGHKVQVHAAPSRESNYRKIEIISTHKNNPPMNIGTHFDYNNHIVLISTHTEQAPHMKRHVLPCKRSEFADSAFSNIVDNFRLCLSLIASKLSTCIMGYKSKFRQGHLIKHIQELL